MLPRDSSVALKRRQDYRPPAFLVDTLDLTPHRVRRIEVRLPPYSHKLVGHPFRIGTNPRVDAQFSARYCVANAIVRRASKLAHFRPEQVGECQRERALPGPDVGPRPARLDGRTDQAHVIRVIHLA